MKIKEYLKQNKEKIKYGSILICATIVAYTMGKRNGAVKAMISVKEPLLTFLSKEDYSRFCDHFDEFYNIKRG